MATYSGYYIDRAAIERRLSVAVVVRAFDDDNIGVVSSDEASSLAQIIKDAEAMFEGYCRGVYDLTALRAAKPNEAVRLCLDIVEFLAAKRFPRALNREWVTLEASCRKELESLRKSITRFDIVGAPDPANQGGEVFNGSTAEPLDVFEPTFLGGWGSY